MRSFTNNGIFNQIFPLWFELLRKVTPRILQNRNIAGEIPDLEENKRFFFAVTMGEGAWSGKYHIFTPFARRNRNGKGKSFVFLGKKLANAKNIFIFPKKAPDQNNFPIFD